MPDALFLPDLSPPVQSLIRIGYGVLMALTLLQLLPLARRFFVSERWGGYAQSSRDVDAIQNPHVLPVVWTLWFASAVAIAVGAATVWAALVNLVLCRYFFIHMRWKGILRGMGAPGFIAYWLGGAIFVLEFCGRYAPDGRGLALLVCQADFALIMLSAGAYKVVSGYPRNHGMEMGLCNPMWGYWWRWYSRRPPNHPLYWTLNELAWATEIAAGALMLIPATRELGGVLIAASFVFILTQIRLGFLCEMVVLIGLLYAPPGGWIESALAGGVPASAIADAGSGWPIVSALLSIGLLVYLALLPFAYGGMWFNFYVRRTLAQPLQRMLERYTNLFGMIIWRVFSADLVNFFVRVHTQAPGGEDRRLVSHFGRWPRFNHVGEMICLTSLFTTLKYYPGNEGIFRQRVLRYARTIPRPAGGIVIFEYCSVIKASLRFDWRPVIEYAVDVEAASVTTRHLDASFSPSVTHPGSPIHEGHLPGSYAPAAR